MPKRDFEEGSSVENCCVPIDVTVADTVADAAEVSREAVGLTDPSVIGEEDAVSNVNTTNPPGAGAKVIVTKSPHALISAAVTPRLADVATMSEIGAIPVEYVNSRLSAVEVEGVTEKSILVVTIDPARRGAAGAVLASTPMAMVKNNHLFIEYLLRSTVIREASARFNACNTMKYGNVDFSVGAKRSERPMGSTRCATGRFDSRPSSHARQCEVQIEPKMSSRISMTPLDGKENRDKRTTRRPGTRHSHHFEKR
jgi:hypothetical protein